MLHARFAGTLTTAAPVRFAEAFAVWWHRWRRQP
jgi:hypothetical protein